MDIDAKANNLPSVTDIIWRKASRSVFVLATFVFFVLFAFYFAVLVVHKRNSLSEKASLMSRTLDTGIDSSDWALTLSHLSASVKEGGLSFAELTTSQGEPVVGPLYTDKFYFFSICDSQALVSNSTIKFKVCAPIITLIELVTVITVLLFMAAIIYFVRGVFMRLASQIVQSMTQHIGSMRMALTGKGEERVVEFSETRELVTEIEKLVTEANRSQVERTRSELVAQIVHDIRSPVTALAMVKSHSSIKNNGDAGALLQSAIERIEKLCDTLLSQYRSGNRVLKSQSEEQLENIVEAIEHTVRDHASTHQSRNILINCRSRYVPALAPLDLLTMQRLIDNLVGNAAHAVLPGSGRIVVDCFTDAKNRKFIVSVVDNGKGIAETDLEKVFEKGFTKDKHGGTGLGLHFVRTAVQGVGGRVKVTSKVGIGTRFELEIPIKIISVDQATYV